MTILYPILLITVVSFIYTWQRVHKQLNIHSTPKISAKIKAKTKYVTNEDGIKIAYQYFPVKTPKCVVVLVHGYSKHGGKVFMCNHVNYLNNAGYSAVILDLRSFGESNGTRVTMGVKEWKDVKAVFNKVKQLPENKNIKIGILGVSMGAATAIITKAKTNFGDFIIASTPYTSFSSLFKMQVKLARLPVLIFYPFVKIASYFELGLNHTNYDPIKLISKIDVPIFIIGAKNDDMVNTNDAKHLYNKATGYKEFWLANTKHDVYNEIPKVFEKRVLGFISKVVE